MLTCTMCGFCRWVCPSLKRRGWESYAPRGLVNIGFGLLKGRLRPTRTLVDSVYSCTTCGSCVVKCPPKIKVRDIVLAIRATLFRNSAAPASIKSLLSSIDRTGNIYGRSSRSTGDETPSLIFFPGCSVRYKHPEILESSLQLLERLGLRASVWGGTDCCGAPYVLGGAFDQFGILAKRSFRALRSSRIVLPCPIGLQTLSASYPTLLREEPPMASHITEILSTGIGSFRFQESCETVTYHDPCYLARLMNVIEPPRKLLNSVPGIRLVEMADSKENTRCCGSGAGITRTYSKELSREIARERMEQARDAGAGRIVTSCPHCLDQLRGVSDALPVDDITVFLASKLQPS